METDAQKVVDIMKQYGQPILKADLKTLTGLSNYGLMKALRNVRYEKNYSAGIRKPALYNLQTVEVGTTSFKRGPAYGGRGRFTAPPGVIASAIQRAIERAKRALNENEIFHALLSSLPAEYAKNLELRKLKALLSWYARQNRLRREDVETPGIAGKVGYFRVIKDLNVGRYKEPRAIKVGGHYVPIEPKPAEEPANAPVLVMEAAKAFQNMQDEFVAMKEKLRRIGEILGE